MTVHFLEMGLESRRLFWYATDSDTFPGQSHYPGPFCRHNGGKTRGFFPFVSLLFIGLHVRFIPLSLLRTPRTRGIFHFYRMEWDRRRDGAPSFEAKVRTLISGCFWSFDNGNSGKFWSRIKIFLWHVN